MKNFIRNGEVFKCLTWSCGVKTYYGFIKYVYFLIAEVSFIMKLDKFLTG